MALNFVTFNQDCSLIAVGTSSGFRVYYADPFSKREETHEGNISLLEMLFSTSLIAHVLSPRRLVITNTKRNSTICELTFPTTILALRLNRKRLVVVLEDQIYIYDLSNMKLVHTIDTSPNPYGICALSPSSERCYLAYPLPQKAAPAAFSAPAHVPPTSPHTVVTSGHILIFDAVSMQAVNVIEAHRTPLSCISMNNDGTRLATASEKGTIIRVFSIPAAQKLFQFRRGSIPSRIFSMSFNMTSTLLCVSSASETIHIFRLSASGQGSKGPESPEIRPRRHSLRSSSPTSEEPSDGGDASERPELGMTERKHNGTFAGMVRRTSQTVGKSFAATIGGYLPSAVSEMLEPTRDFAWFKVPRLSGSSSGSMRTVVAMSSNSPQVMVVTSDGDFLVFNIDLEKGGEGTLTKQYSVLDNNDRPRQSTAD